MIERVLIAVEDEDIRMEPLTAHAVDLLEGQEVEVVLLHVYSESQFDEALGQLDMSSMDPTELAKRNKTVRSTASTLREAGHALSIVGTVGDPVDEIVTYLDEHDIDHVFLGSRKRSPTGKALLGSVAQDVMLSVAVPCTVFVNE